MTATRSEHCKVQAPALYVAFELGWNEWKLAFSVGLGQKPRFKQIVARNLKQLQAEIAQAKKRFELPADAAVFSCYEAGRDGFWLHRYLTAQGVVNVVVDSASIEVKRQLRRAKADRLDAQKLLTMLLRYRNGESKVWSVVQVPSVAEEDRRELHRGLMTLKEQRTAVINRIKGLLAKYGIAVEVGAELAEKLKTLRMWDGQPLPPGLQERLRWDLEEWQQVDKRIRTIEKQRQERLRTASEPAVDQVRRLLGLRGVGVQSAWLVVMELFSWRRFANRRQLGSLSGLTPTPYQSGDSNHEQGISKAGNRWLRAVLIEVAWSWLRYQPGSALSRWYQQRFNEGRRQRRIGIVAVARKLLIALWRYLEHGEVPAGAVLVDWEAKLKGRCVVLQTG